MPMNTHVLLVTETWLTSGSFPTNWSQFHLYGSKVPGAFNRGSGGITAFVSPSCPFSVSQLPSYNAHTLSLKVGTLTVHCVYLPPPLSSDKVLSLLRSLPVTSDTILCGDFNARFGSLLGDTNANPRGTSLLPWLEESSFSILNESLAFGTPTFTTFRRQQEVHSIIDLFLTNIGEAALLHPQLVVESDLSLGSDHRLMTAMEALEIEEKAAFWACFVNPFELLLLLWLVSLSGLVSAPPGVCPDIDAINDSLNQCLYESLDSSIGVKSGRPGHWKKYWTQEIEDAARERDTMYSRWRWASRFAKVETWNLYQAAHRRFRSLVQAAKRRSWNQFCSDLEKDFSKATAAIKRIKRNKECSATYSHPDGPTASVNTMASHLASVYDGSLLNNASRLAAPSNFSDLPYDVSTADLGLFDADTLVSLIKRLPNGKAPGPDHLKAEMLKALASDIAPVLSLLFTLCSQWSYTPALWRHAQVFPIYKKGDVSDPANFRPISLTSVMRKLFEFSLMPALDEHSPALDVAQGGFRPQRSPLDQALCLHDLMHDYFLTTTTTCGCFPRHQISV
ncbi:histone acetyltransferase 1 [Mucor velutinosus]|uniref:Histone acetyltransferase 1 n=1 Tax=Mucor velutinosus TaxID=708070 RepID=A0AAN7HX75_9FUNG|nr:histone acetyltransferase 1 [Mucor velutinosus]